MPLERTRWMLMTWAAPTKNLTNSLAVAKDALFPTRSRSSTAPSPPLWQHANRDADEALALARQLTDESLT